MQLTTIIIIIIIFLLIIIFLKCYKVVTSEVLVMVELVEKRPGWTEMF